MEAAWRRLRDDAWVVSSPADAATATAWRERG